MFSFATYTVSYDVSKQRTRCERENLTGSDCCPLSEWATERDRALSHGQAHVLRLRFCTGATPQRQGEQSIRLSHLENDCSSYSARFGTLLCRTWRANSASKATGPVLLRILAIWRLWRLSLSAAAVALSAVALFRSIWRRSWLCQRKWIWRRRLWQRIWWRRRIWGERFGMSSLQYTGNHIFIRICF